MNITVLDEKSFETKKWLLCKSNLKEYLSNLKEDFYTFSIQRKIVKNQYLDGILKTIELKEPIPLITLTYSESVDIDGRDAKIDNDKIEILDGLQRTFRLWAYFTIIEKYFEWKIENPIDFAKRIKEDYSVFFDSGIITLTSIKRFFSEEKFNNYRVGFSSYEIYFIIWVKLTEEEVIQKMLQLNAGQKSVSKTHQYELLFLHLWDKMKSSNSSIMLFREKDKNSNNIKRGDRTPGQYMFSTLIVGLRSLIEGKALRVRVDDFVNPSDDEESNTVEIRSFIFSERFITKFLANLVEIDNKLIQKEPKEGNKWFVKDTTISGILGGIGSFIEAPQFHDPEKLTEGVDNGFKLLLDKIGNNGFNLIEFTTQYNVLSSRSVNIGDFIRKAIMDYTIMLLKGEQPTWEQIFKSNQLN